MRRFTIREWIIGGTISVIALLAVVYTLRYTSLLQPLPCSHVLDKKLLSVQLPTSATDQVEEWIRTNFLVFPLTLGSSVWDEKTTAWEWKTVGHNYRIVQSGEHSALSHSWFLSTPTIKDALRCLGNPEVYLSFVETVVDAHFFHLFLLYPESDLLVAVVYITRDIQPLVTKEMGLFYVERVPSSSVAQMVQRHYTINSSYRRDERLSILLAALRPWPGSVQEIDPPIVVK